MVFEGFIDLGVAIFVLLALAEYSKHVRKGEKGWHWLAVAGVWFLFAGTFPMLEASLGSYFPGFWSPLTQLFEIVAWFLALIGTLLVLYEKVLQER